MGTDVRTDLFRFESDALPKKTQVAAFRGREGLSELYRFEIGLLVPEGEEVDLDAAIGKRAKLSATPDAAKPEIAWHGIISRIDLVHAWLNRALYRVVLVPEIWRLNTAPRSYVEVDTSVPELIELILKLPTPAEYEMRLKESYSKRGQLIQYRETPYAFISRWMERRGIYFFFEHGEKMEKVIVTDNGGAHEPSRSEPVRYVPLSGSDSMAVEALDSFMCVRTALPRMVQFRDYDHQNPNLVVIGKADICPDDRTGRVDIPGDNFAEPAVGDRIAAAYAGAELARKQVHCGTGRVFGLRSGYKFTLEGHPVESVNKEYLVVTLEHEGNQAADDEVRKMLGVHHKDEYRVTVTAIDAEVQYRTERRTPWPRIYSMERAFIDGPEESEYAQIDDEGRYKVQIAFDQHWDQTAFDGTASAWVRMMQPHGGQVEGFHFPLRRGTEVVLSFVGGDPDQPVIAGVVPNALRVSPVTKANHTQNVIQTGGKNRFEMEDQKDKQYIDISTPPKDTRIHLGEPHGKHGSYIVFNTGGDQFVNIGGPRKIEVGGTLKEHVKGAVTWDHDATRTDTVKGAVKEDYGANHRTTVHAIRSEHVTGNYFRNYSANLDTIVGGTVVEQYGSTQTTTVSGALTYKAGPTTFTFGKTVFNFGDTKLNFGSTNIAWKSTKGIIASLSLQIPGGATIDTPRWDCTAPTSHFKWADWKVIGFAYGEYVGFKFGAFAFKIDVGPVSFAATGLKIEKTDVSIASKSLDISVGGVKAKSKSIWSAFCGVYTLT
jgi:type VI secretion system secreted protein VgrG